MGHQPTEASLFSLPPSSTCTVAVIGVGYVGLPLALAFGTPVGQLQRPVIAFDLNQERLAELERGVDRTLEASSEELDAATLVRYSAEPAEPHAQPPAAQAALAPLAAPAALAWV